MQVKKKKFETWEKALVFARDKLSEGYANIRIITARGQRAKNYGIVGEEAQVRYW